MSSVLVVGAGLTGLSLTRRLLRLSPTTRVVLAEASPVAGGWVGTERNGAWTFERGPRAFNATRGQATIALLADLGLHDRVVCADASNRIRYVLTRDTDRPISAPGSIAEALQSSMTRGAVRHLARDMLAGWFGRSSAPQQDLSIHEFFAPRIGTTATNLLVSAMVAGIYAGDARRLSASSCFPAVTDLVRHHRSLLAGLWSGGLASPPPPVDRQSDGERRIYERLAGSTMFSLEGGLQTLIDAMIESVGPALTTSCTVQRVCPRTLTASFKDGTKGAFDAVFCTNTTPSIADMIDCGNGGHEDLIAALRSVSYASLAVVSLGWNRLAADPNVLRGFGVLVPDNLSSAPRILGITIDSDAFPDSDRPEQTRLTVMMGGDRHPEMIHASSEDLSAIAIDAAARLIGISSAPDFVQVHRAKQAIPQYYVGHSRLVQRILTGAADANTRFRILGTAVDGVSINDCVRAGHREAEDLYIATTAALKKPVQRPMSSDTV